MSYQINIPDEAKEGIIKVIDQMRGRMSWPYHEREYLMRMYYRYVERLYPDETVEGKVKRDIGCGNCNSKIKYYFKNEVTKWRANDSAKKSAT